MLCEGRSFHFYEDTYLKSCHLHNGEGREGCYANSDLCGVFRTEEFRHIVSGNS